jgi:hypothetical protein
LLNLGSVCREDVFNLLKRSFSTGRGTEVDTRGLDFRAASPSRNSTLHGATEAQSSIEPEDYPDEKRQVQVDAATGRPGTIMPPPD